MDKGGTTYPRVMILHALTPLQLAYYRMEKRFVPTYEPAMMRLWRDGRTETIRSCSKNSCAFVLAMEDPSGMVHDGSGPFRGLGCACWRGGGTSAPCRYALGVLCIPVVVF